MKPLKARYQRQDQQPAPAEKGTSDRVGQGRVWGSLPTHTATLPILAASATNSGVRLFGITKLKLLAQWQRPTATVKPAKRGK